MSANITTPERAGRPALLPVPALAMRRVAAYFVASPVAMAGLAFVVAAALLSLGVP